MNSLALSTWGPLSPNFGMERLPQNALHGTPSVKDSLFKHSEVLFYVGSPKNSPQKNKHLEKHLE